MADQADEGELDKMTTEVPMLLRAEEAARLLSLGRSTVFAMLATGELPSVRIGRAVRVPRVALEAWIRARTEHRAEEQLPSAAIENAAMPIGSSRDLALGRRR